jgi:hypothetical protein
MTQLSIPQEAQRGFIVIRQLEEDQVQELVAALSAEEPTLYRSELRRRVGKKTASISSTDLGEILRTLVSVYALRDDLDQPMSDVVRALCDAMEETDVEALHFSDEADRNHFATRLSNLLGAASLEVTAKSTELFYEHERTVHGKPRVLTDIRPVFGLDPEEPPKGAMIVHTLKITYHEGEQVREFFVTLDSSQIGELVDVLGRASLKAESLRETLELPLIETD